MESVSVGEWRFILSSVDAWNMYMHFRQLELIIWNRTVPKVLGGALSKEEYEYIRRLAAGKEVLQIINSATMLYCRFTHVFESYTSCIWTTLTPISDVDMKLVVFSCLDEIFTQSTFVIPLIIVKLLVADVDVSPAQVVSYVAKLVAISAIYTGIKTYLSLKATNNFGKDFFVYLLIVQEVFIVFGPIIFIQFVFPFLLPPLPTGLAKDNIDRVAEKASYYPRHAIYHKRASGKLEGPSEVYHTGHLGASMIVVPEAAVNVIGEADIGGVVAHELGHWYYMVQPMSKLLHRVILNYWYATSASEAYGNESVYEMFHIPNDQSVHPYMGTLLFCKYIFPSITSVIDGLFGLIRYFCTYAADGFASRLGFESQLRNSLVTHFTKFRIFPNSDHWYGIWFEGRPGMIKRMERLS